MLPQPRNLANGTADGNPFDVRDFTYDFEINGGGGPRRSAPANNLNARLYARAGVGEMWLVNLHEDVLEVYTRPENGAYRDRKQFTKDDSISLTTIPGLTVSVEDILG